jgi:hypothetical protein
MSGGIPFLGEDGYYPPWALAAHRAQWLFQRTLASVRDDIASEIAARQVPSAIRNVTDIAKLIREEGITPENWRLVCPICGGLSGPDLTPVTVECLLTQWHKVARPKLENPSAGRFWRSAAPATDLDRWIRELDPTKLELAYLGQQMWPDIGKMLDECKSLL